MDPVIETLEDIQLVVDDCCGFEDGVNGACYHCRQKQYLINLACAWAFEVGLERGLDEYEVTLG